MKARWLIAIVVVVLAVVAGPKLLDRTPPEVVGESWQYADPASPGATKEVTDAPTDALRGDPIVTFQVEDAHALTAELTLDGVAQTVTVDSGSVMSKLDLSKMPDGQHVLTLLVKDTAWPANRTQITRSLTTDRTAPAFTLARSSESGAQGRTLALFARANEPVADASATFGDESVRAVVLDDSKTVRALVGVDVKQEPGPVEVRIEARDEAGNVGQWEGTVTVTETDFPDGGVVTLSAKKQTDMMDKQRTEESNQKRGDAYGKEVGVALSEAAFVTPIEGILTSPFGKVRRYNTGVVRHHLGTDLAAPSGTPVKAAADGVVTLAEELHIYGNAVIINHTDGVSTSYNHLSRIDVKAGDTVKAGEIVGAVGSTGQSTGPHLHWGMVVNGHAVAAEQWAERSYAAPLEGDFEGL